MEQTTAFHIGQIIGVLIVLAIMGGGLIFFVVALVKAFTTRKTGWIVAASVCAVPVLVLILCLAIGFIVGFSKGFKQARERAGEVAAAKQGQPSTLLTADMTAVTGNLIPYEISLPSADGWTKTPNHRPYDYVFSYGDAYMGAIVEGIGLNTPQRVYDFAKKNVSAKASEFSATDPTPIEIDSREWLTFDVNATMTGIKIKYRYYVYADATNTVQLISWTGPALFDRYAPVFDRIAKSFKLPKQ